MLPDSNQLIALPLPPGKHVTVSKQQCDLELSVNKEAS